MPGCTYTGADDFEAIATTNIGGVFPFKINDTLACRAWKLAATICNSEPISYLGYDGDGGGGGRERFDSLGTGADSWNFQCRSSGGFIDPRFGTYCPVATQYICTTPPPPTPPHAPPHTHTLALRSIS